MASFSAAPDVEQKEVAAKEASSSALQTTAQRQRSIHGSEAQIFALGESEPHSGQLLQDSISGAEAVQMSNEKVVAAPAPGIQQSETTSPAGVEVVGSKEDWQSQKKKQQERTKSKRDVEFLLQKIKKSEGFYEADVYDELLQRVSQRIYKQSIEKTTSAGSAADTAAYTTTSAAIENGAIAATTSEPFSSDESGTVVACSRGSNQLDQQHKSEDEAAGKKQVEKEDVLKRLRRRALLASTEPTMLKLPAQTHFWATAFQKFAQKEIDSEVCFDDLNFQNKNLMKLSLPVKVASTRGLRFRCESMTDKYQRLLHEIPAAVLAAKEYLKNMAVLAERHASSESVSGNYIFLLNKELAEKQRGLEKRVREVAAAAAAALPSEICFFKKENPFSEYKKDNGPERIFSSLCCPEDCVSLDALAALARKKLVVDSKAEKTTKLLVKKRAEASSSSSGTIDFLSKNKQAAKLAPANTPSNANTEQIKRANVADEGVTRRAVTTGVDRIIAPTPDIDEEIEEPQGPVASLSPFAASAIKVVAEKPAATMMTEQDAPKREAEVAKTTQIEEGGRTEVAKGGNETTEKQRRGINLRSISENTQADDITNAPLKFQNVRVLEEAAVAHLQQRIQTLNERLQVVSLVLWGSEGLPDTAATAADQPASAGIPNEEEDLVTRVTRLSKFLHFCSNDLALRRLHYRFEVFTALLREQSDRLHQQQQKQHYTKQQQQRFFSRQEEQQQQQQKEDDFEEELPDEWRPEKMVEKLYEAVASPLSSSAASEQVEYLQSRIDHAFASFQSLVRLLKQVRIQESQDAALVAMLASLGQVLQQLNEFTNCGMAPAVTHEIIAPMVLKKI